MPTAVSRRNVHVAGGAAAPVIAGTVVAPEGSYNGLAFRDAGGRLAIESERSGAARRRRPRDRRQTHATFRASVAGNALGIAATSPAADLADFDDYFDESEIMAGRGPLSFTFVDTTAAHDDVGRDRAHRHARAAVSARHRRRALVDQRRHDRGRPRDRRQRRAHPHQRHDRADRRRTGRCDARRALRCRHSSDRARRRHAAPGRRFPRVRFSDA